MYQERYGLHYYYRGRQYLKLNKRILGKTSRKVELLGQTFHVHLYECLWLCACDCVIVCVWLRECVRVMMWMCACDDVIMCVWLCEYVHVIVWMCACDCVNVCVWLCECVRVIVWWCACDCVNVCVWWCECVRVIVWMCACDCVNMCMWWCEYVRVMMWMYVIHVLMTYTISHTHSCTNDIYHITHSWLTQVINVAYTCNLNKHAISINTQSQ